MNVTIKKFGVQMEVKNNGIEFEIKTPAGTDHLGDMVINKAGMIWCQGQTNQNHGKKKSWEDIIAFFNS